MSKYDSYKLVALLVSYPLNNSLDLDLRLRSGIMRLNEFVVGEEMQSPQSPLVEITLDSAIGTMGVQSLMLENAIQFVRSLRYVIFCNKILTVR